MNLITGPGNIYVTAAKRLLKGRVNIDSEAGPTEIAILADASAEPAFVAADLISQAEHGSSSAAVLITADTDLVDRTQVELKARVPDGAAPRADRGGADRTAVRRGPGR